MKVAYPPMQQNNTKMEPYITFISTDFNAEKKQFTDRIRYDGYDFSLTVTGRELQKTYDALEFLFQTPSITGVLNIANLDSWGFHFYDTKGRLCAIEKNGDYVYLVMPHYNMIRTDVSSGIMYLRIFYENVKHLNDVVNPSQIIAENA